MAEDGRNIQVKKRRRDTDAKCQWDCCQFPLARRKRVPSAFALRRFNLDYIVVVLIENETSNLIVMGVEFQRRV
jgi:hypothetical protein